MGIPRTNTKFSRVGFIALPSLVLSLALSPITAFADGDKPADHSPASVAEATAAAEDSPLSIATPSDTPATLPLTEATPATSADFTTSLDDILGLDDLSIVSPSVDAMAPNAFNTIKEAKSSGNSSSAPDAKDDYAVKGNFFQRLAKFYK